MNRLFCLRRPSVQRLLAQLVWLGLMGAVLTLAAVPNSWAQNLGTKTFDHLKTGFALSGTHSTLRCESCHINGVFKGTPRDCQSCHTIGTRFSRANTVLPSRHIPIKQTCDSCHGTQSFSGARFTHTAVMPGTCSSCHDNLHVSGKPGGHLATTAACDTCHTTSTWTAARPEHGAFTSTTDCASCHNGRAATGKPGAHIPTEALRCGSCHSVNSWRPSSWNHTQTSVVAKCSSCHSGAYPPADGKPGNHIPYQTLSGVAIANCDSCHKGGYRSWNPGRFHANVSVSGQCATCHLTSAYGLTAKPNTAVHSGVTGNCESCHNSSSGWAGARVDHSKFTVATQCASCHNGSAATGKPGGHIPVAANCISCHNVSSWRPTKWNHTQVPVTAQCSSCHSGAYAPADGKPSNHIPYQTLSGVAIANCDSCHKGGYSTWTGARFHAHVAVSSQCATCHLTTAYGLTAKPNTAVHSGVTGNCESCHNSSGWAGARVDHSKFTVATQCASCHNGSAATGKPGAHIPVAANCISCHNVSSWRPTKWNHTQVPVTAQCSSCHSGAYAPADGKPSNHIPYQTLSGVAIANCDSCHKSGYSTWAGGRFHAHVAVIGQCSSCHLSSAYGLTAKPNTAVHNGVTGNCESCHRSTASWNTVTFAHAPSNAVGTGTCDTCHNGASASGKPANHIPIQVGGVKCDACHKSQAAWTSSVSMNHAAVSAQACKVCHLSTYASAGATAKPNNHIPETQLLNGSAMDCKACHSKTTAGGFATAAMNHNNSQGNGSGWCFACHNSGTSYLGGMERKALSHRSRNATDCSQSGCHRPIGNVGSTYRNWD